MRWVIAAALLPTIASADVDPCACSPNKPGFHRGAVLMGDWDGIRSDLHDDGVEISAVYTGETFAAPGLDDDRATVAGLGSLALQADLATLVHDDMGVLRISGFAIHGDGLPQLGEVFGVSNNVAPNEVRLFEAWIEQPIGALTVRAGLLSADQELIIAEHASVLLGATFGVPASFSYNVGAPVYPVAAVGASARLELADITLRGAVYAGEQENDHGIPEALGDEALTIGEVTVATIKLGAWHHTMKGTGYYGILDDQPARFVGAFTRIAVAPNEPMSFYVDAGVRIGPGPFRPRDFISAGMAFARTDVGSQTIVEATYQALITKWLTVQPDVQLVLTREATYGVLGARVVVAL